MPEDNYSLWQAHDRAQEQARDRLPVCDRCREPIDDDEYFDIHGEILCYDCLHVKYRKWTEDYIK